MKINESDFEYRGYRCVTTFTDFGERCGYVGVPEGHPLYGKGWGTQIKATYEDLAEQPIGKRSLLQLFALPDVVDHHDNRVKIEFYFNVHGGITYLNGGKGSTHPVESDLWWLGFDCGHAGDAKDYELLEKLWGDDEKIQWRLKNRLEFKDDVLRTVDYVQQECRDLVDQIIDYCERYEVIA